MLLEAAGCQVGNPVSDPLIRRSQVSQQQLRIYLQNLLGLAGILADFFLEVGNDRVADLDPTGLNRIQAVDGTLQNLAFDIHAFSPAWLVLSTPASSASAI